MFLPTKALGYDYGKEGVGVNVINIMRVLWGMGLVDLGQMESSEDSMEKLVVTSPGK